MPPFSGKSEQLNFLTPVQSEYQPLTFYNTYRQNHVSHLKNNYIFGILEWRPMIWHTFKQNWSTFNFDPLITLWGNFKVPYFKMLNDARVASACLSDMSKSQKQQKYCNYTRLPSSKFILLFVNSTKCPEMQRKWFFGKKILFFDFFGQNFQKYCLIQKFEKKKKKKTFLELCLIMIFRQF